MEEEPQKEIMLDPRWSILEDGLGYNVLVVSGVPSIDSDGREIVTFIIKPDETVRKRYNLRRGIELDDNGNMKLNVLKIDLVPLNMYDDANKKWLYVKSLKHDNTTLSQREENLKSVLESKIRRILLLEAETIRLAEQLEIARTNPVKFLQQYKDVFHESAKALAEISMKKDKNE